MSPDHESSAAPGYAEHRMSALRTNNAPPLAERRQDCLSPGGGYPLRNFDRIYERSQGVSDRAAHSGGRLDGYGSQQIPRETFMREISGVKYDYRPMPRDDGRESYYRNGAVNNGVVS